MASIQVNVPSPSITMNGNKTVTSSLNWTPPNLPVGATVTSATLTGSWTWNGKGTISSMTIGGTSTSNAIPFTHTLTDTEISNNSISISATGSNKNVTGNNFTWTSLIITYEYEIKESNVLYQKKNGVWEEVKVIVGYKKIDGVWVEQPIGTLFDVNANYKKGVV